MTAQLRDPAFRQTEIPDAGPDEGDEATEVACQRPGCGEVMPLDSMHLTHTGRLVCVCCWLDGFELRPKEAA